jgi:ribose-phosphate pyrophosphokinase
MIHLRLVAKRDCFVIDDAHRKSLANDRGPKFEHPWRAGSQVCESDVWVFRIASARRLGVPFAVRIAVIRNGTPDRRIHAFDDTAAFARRLARAAGVSSARVRVHRFPDGESLVRVARPVGRHAYVVRSLHDPNAKLVETVLAADALRRGGARTGMLVAPYLPYMRQDATFRAGEPVSQRVIGACLGRAFDGVLTVEAHLHRVARLRSVIPGASRSLAAAPAIAAWLGADPDAWLVGPDAESRPWVEAIARAARARCVIARKQRRGDREVAVRVPPVPAGIRAVIVDDIASSGATIAATARALRRAGAGVVDAVVVHAIFAPGARRRMREAGVRRVVSCDTIPHPTNAIPLAALLAQAIAAEGSV